MLRLFFNGKFTAQRTTGVQRFARQLLLALDDAVSDEDAERWTLLVPPQGIAPRLRRIAVRPLGPPGLPLHVWEQLVLPAAAGAGLLVNLSGSAPLLARRQWSTLHDAAVFDHPGAYTRIFAGWYRMNFRCQARRALQLLTVSEHSQRRLALRLGIAPAAIAVVRNGGDHLLAISPDADVISRLGLGGLRWLLAVGSDNPMKNRPLLLQAWRQLQPPADLRLVLVGGTDDAVFAGAPPPASVPGVLRAGVVSDAALKSLYSGALGLVFPSFDEGFGLPPLEAMSLGCAVAAAAAGAIPEVCGDAGLLFDPWDAAAIGAAMRQLIDDAALRERLVAAGLLRAASMTWRHSAQCLLGLLGAHREAA